MSSHNCSYLWYLSGRITITALLQTISFLWYTFFSFSSAQISSCSIAPCLSRSSSLEIFSFLFLKCIYFIFHSLHYSGIPIAYMLIIFVKYFELSLGFNSSFNFSKYIFSFMFIVLCMTTLSFSMLRYLHLLSFGCKIFLLIKPFH